MDIKTLVAGYEPPKLDTLKGAQLKRHLYFQDTLSKYKFGDVHYLSTEESKKQIEEAKRRRKLYVRDSKEKIKGKTVILVDDGVATGLSLRLAIDEVKKQNPKKLIVAVPVSPRETAVDLRRKVDEFVADQIPKVYAGAVGAYYNEFNQVTDDEVIKLINKLKDNGR